MKPEAVRDIAAEKQRERRRAVLEVGGGIVAGILLVSVSALAGAVIQAITGLIQW